MSTKRLSLSWLPAIDWQAHGRNKYLPLAQAIAQAIGQGQLVAESKLPPQRLLADAIGVTLGTVTRAYQWLLEQGWVEARVGDGTYVKSQTKANGFNDHCDFSSCQQLLLEQVDEMSKALKALSRQPERIAKILKYQTQPDSRYADAVLNYLALKGIRADASQLLLSHGGQQALFSIINALPTDGVIVHEALSYPGIVAACRANHRPTHAIALTEHGMDLEALAQLCQHTRVTAVYVTVNNQNPTCIRYSDAIREQLLALAERYDFYLIEDDVNYCLPEEWHSPMWQQANERVCYIGSFSKTFSGGLRLGFCLLPSALQLAVRQASHAQCWSMAALAWELALPWLAQPIAPAREQLVRDRQRAVLQQLASEHWQLSQRGLNTWLQLPAQLSSSRVVTELAKLGIVVRDGKAMCFAGEINAIRITQSAQQDLSGFVLQLARIKALILELMAQPLAIL